MVILCGACLVSSCLKPADFQRYDSSDEDTPFRADARQHLDSCTSCRADNYTIPEKAERCVSQVL